jgi:RNA polymerase sigma-70 factor (ECF subfamily)
MLMTEANDTFESYRPLMFAIAYRMLGSAMDAEDIVQEAFLRYQQAENVRTPKALLTTIVTRLCLDQLKSAREQRESYIGPWLPEPLITTPLDDANESISMAFLILLESLTPVERAVFLLREVFDYDYREIAEIVGKEEAACRQSFHRAKAHIAEHRPRFPTSPEEHRQILERFMQACIVGELDGLTTLLAENVSMIGDGGGKASAATRPIYGENSVARFLLGTIKRLPPDYSMQIHAVNGRPAFMFYDEKGLPNTLMMFDINEGKIRTIYNQRNPDKLHEFEHHEE